MNRNIYRIAGLLLVTAVLAGCGGGGGGGGGGFPIGGIGGGGSGASNEAVDKFIAYVKTLVETAIDTAEPADVTAYDPPATTDTAEPAVVQ
ncbi:conserved hypothetical protein [Burkholderiales bacterium 8X]|nr:conserved hypothetical protein [Burkholderiales bacterium 8X]